MTLVQTAYHHIASMILHPSEPDVRTIVQRIDSDDIDLQPDFQRQEVWSTPKKRRLIDTILRGWSVPPVHLVEIANSRLEVLDGQQRLTALRDFVHNQFSVDGNITPRDPAIERLHGVFYQQLPAAVRRRIDQYPIRCFKITDYSPEEPSELFYRLNQPTALTAGEQRNALFGPARQQLKELVVAFESLGNSKETLSFSNARLAYDDIIARLLFFLEQETFGVKSTEARVSERFRQRTPFNNHVIDTAEQSLNYFSDARERSMSYRFNKASVLSFLLFYSRFTNNEPDDTFIGRFAASKKRTAHNSFVPEAADLFEDRASLRVTDVSSVIYRDFCLWFVYYHYFATALPPQIPVNTIRRIADAYNGRDDFTFEQTLQEVLRAETWAATL